MQITHKVSLGVFLEHSFVEIVLFNNHVSCCFVLKKAVDTLLCFCQTFLNKICIKNVLYPTFGGVL